MLSKPMLDAINSQIQKELYSAYLYLSMSIYFEQKNLPGFAQWLKVQFQEEQGHALKFLEFVQERGGGVVLRAIQQPPSTWNSNMEAFQEVLKHEQAVTASINALYEVALSEKDYPSQILLQWYINEQVEEEKNATDIINMLEMIGDSPVSLIMADRQLGARK